MADDKKLTTRAEDIERDGTKVETDPNKLQSTAEQTIVADTAKTVSDAQGNIINVKTLKRSPDFFDFEFDVEVEDSRRLTQIVAALRALAVVDSAERVKG